MKIIQSVCQARSIFADLSTQKRSRGFVPTMGALHEGHLSLVRKSGKENEINIVSVFVNPTQFGPKEDLEKYPRPFEKDVQLLKEEGVDFLFAPQAPDIYPEGYSTFIEETKLSSSLCGAFRPGHFRGVTTVVFKLLSILKPTRMYLGQKDAQQLRVIEKMVEDLCLNVNVVECPTLREADGLAMSSRNAYLSTQEREMAPALYRALDAAKKAYEAGEKSAAQLTSLVCQHLNSFPAFDIQYAQCRRWQDFSETETIQEKTVLAVAVFLGHTRLIDNVFLDPSNS